MEGRAKEKMEMNLVSLNPQKCFKSHPQQYVNLQMSLGEMGCRLTPGRERQRKDWKEMGEKMEGREKEKM